MIFVGRQKIWKSCLGVTNAVKYVVMNMWIMMIMLYAQSVEREVMKNESGICQQDVTNVEDKL